MDGIEDQVDGPGGGMGSRVEIEAAAAVRKLNGLVSCSAASQVLLASFEDCDMSLSSLASSIT